MRGDEVSASDRMMYITSSNLVGGSTTNMSSNMESPPPDAVWTIDSILQKPPMAPVRPRTYNNAHGNSHRNNNEYFPLCYDVRNQEGDQQDENENDQYDDDYEHNNMINSDNQSKDHRSGSMYNYDDDDEEDEEMIHLHRMILPSRKLFMEEDNDEDVMHLDESFTDNAFRPVLFDLTRAVPTNDSTQRSTHHPPMRLLLPSLQHIDDVSSVEEEEKNSSMDRLLLFRNHPLPFEQRFEPVLTDDDVIISATSSSTSDDGVSSYNGSLSNELYSQQQMNHHHDGGARGVYPIFRRLDANDDSTPRDRASALLFRPLSSSLFESNNNDSINYESDSDHS